MCGIAGIVGAVAERPQIVRAMTAALAHRGPDNHGFYDDAHCSLGHRRLSIIDLSPAGRQPIGSADGAIQVIFNGEIYNHADLRKRLQQAGYQFRSRTDTEVIVYLYEKYGHRFVDHLRGMFAIAIWDSRRRRLLLARDPFGQKPLFYAHVGDTLLFGSEIKALLCAPSLPRTIDALAIDVLLTIQFVPSPMSCYSAVRRLEAASCLAFEVGQAPRTWRYWTLANVQPRPLREEEALEEVDAHLTRAVREQMVSDVPVGMFLSGGIDSSLILSKLHELRMSNLDAFCVGYQEGAFDELVYAREVAERFGARLHPIVLDSNEAKDPEQLLALFDEPFADVAAIPMTMLCKQARRKMTVAITGDGGDELLGGYDYHVMGYWLDRVAVASQLRGKIASAATRLVPPDGRFRSPLRTLRKALQAFSYPDWKSAITSLRATLLLPQRKALYQMDYLASLSNAEPYPYLYADPSGQGGADSVQQLFRLGGDRMLADQLLFKSDIASMATGLECRSPLLDVPLTELVTGLPLDLKVRGFRGKHLFRKLLSKKVGKNIWGRRKMGFTMPIENWLREDLAPLVNDTLLAPNAKIAAFVRPDQVARLYEEHRVGAANWRRLLWALLLLELWLRKVEPAATQIRAA